MRNDDEARQAMIDGLRLASAAAHALGCNVGDFQRLAAAAWEAHAQLAESWASAPPKYAWLKPPPKSRHLRIVK